VDAAERPLSWEGFGGSVSGAVLLATVESAGGSTRPDGSPITTYATSIRVRDWDSRVMATACTCEDHEHHVTEGDAAHVIGDTPGGFGSYVWACKHVVAVADRYREVRRAELKAR
jgi:hypothetical protein